MHAAKDSNLLMTLGFCQWYRTSNSTPTGFSINSFGVKLISQQLKRKVTEKSEGKRVRVPGLREFIAVDDSEARMQEVLTLKRIQVLKLEQLLLVG